MTATRVWEFRHTPEIFARLVEMARQGVLTPRVAASYPLSDIAAAQERFQEVFKEERGGLPLDDSQKYP